MRVTQIIFLSFSAAVLVAPRPTGDDACVEEIGPNGVVNKRGGADADTWYITGC